MTVARPEGNMGEETVTISLQGCFLYGDNERRSWPSLSIFIIIFQFSRVNLLPGTKHSHSLLWELFP